MLMYENIWHSVQDLNTFDPQDLQSLQHYFNISMDIPKQDVIWLIALNILQNHKIAFMAPAKVWSKYGDLLKKKLKQDSDTNFDTAKDTFEKADPTNNKKYLEWIVKSYTSDGIKKYEDLLLRVLPALQDYEYLKISKHLQKSAQAYNDETNILNYCGLVGCSKGKFRQLGLEDLIEKYADVLAKRTKQLETAATTKEEGTIVFEGPTVRIIQPLTEAAACYYGKGTRWCTAATRGSNEFEEYIKDGPLYILIPKEPEYKGEKYQLHFESESYMNEEDDSVSFGKLLQRFPDLKTWDIVPNQEHFNIAIDNGDADAVKRLLQDVQVDPAAHDNQAIIESSINGHTDVVKLLLDDGRAVQLLMITRRSNTAAGMDAQLFSKN